MNNLPSNMKRHTVFRDNPYSHTVVFPDDYPLPDESDIKMQVRQNGRILAGITPTISVDGQRVTYTYTPEMLAKLPEITNQYLVLDGVSLIGGELGARIGYGEQEISETVVSVVDGEVTVVQVMGLDLVAAQVGIATEKAEEATQGAATATDQAGIATTKATEAEASAVAAALALDAAEGELAKKLDAYYVDTYSDLVTFVTSPSLGPCGVLVLSDESYEAGKPRWYVYSGAGGVSGLVKFITYTENA